MRGRAGYVGFNRTASTTSASGVWTVREAEALRRSGEWPRGPLAPTSLTATAGNAQISLSWTAPATTYGTITNYIVEYTPSGGSAVTVLTGSTGTSYTLTGLTNGTSYTVRVAAVNFTTGDWSGTATGTPVAEVQYLTITNSGPFSVTGNGTPSTPFVAPFASTPVFVWSYFIAQASSAATVTVSFESRSNGLEDDYVRWGVSRVGGTSIAFASGSGAQGIRTYTFAVTAGQSFQLAWDAGDIRIVGISAVAA
jgi:hypothetical protein